jgi:hypothetical protein
MTWAPSSIRVSLAVVVALALGIKVLPIVARFCGQALGAASIPACELLTYPEFLLTSLSRRIGRRPLPGTFAYGRVLGSVAGTGTWLGRWLSQRFAVSPRYPKKSVLLVVALVAGCWYLAPQLPLGAFRTTLGRVNDDVVRIDSWLATGKWTPVANSTLICPSEVTPSKSPAKPKPPARSGSVKPKP